MKCFTFVKPVFFILFFIIPLSVKATEIVLEQEDFQRFIGRIDLDPTAIDGKAVFLDPLMGQTPEIKVPAGKYTAYIHARSTIPPAPDKIICQLKILSVGQKKPIYIHNIMSGDLFSQSKYRTLVIPFDLLEPGTIILMLDAWQMGHNDIFLDSMGLAGQDIMKRWNWDEMTHNLGVAIEDQEAISGMAWTNAHALAYGPYISLPNGPGRYEVIFRIAIDPCLKATNIATLDVFAHDGHLAGNARGNKVYAARGLETDNFPRPNQYTDFRLSFLYDGASQMEFRVLLYYVMRDAVRLDRITVRKLVK